MRYDLDLETVLDLLQESHSTGSLTASIPPKLLKNKEPWHAHVELAEGKITSCVVTDAHGITRLSSETALNRLLDTSTLSWTFQQKTPSKALPFGQARTTDSLPRLTTPLPISEPLSPLRRRTTSQLPPPQSGFSSGIYAVPRTPVYRTPIYAVTVPRRVGDVNPNMTHKWTRLHRHTYSLVDGQRSVEKIRSMLALQPQEIEKVLYDLEFMGVITLL